MSQFVNVDELRRHQALPEGQEKWSNQNLNLIFSSLNSSYGITSSLPLKTSPFQNPGNNTFR